MTSKAYDALYMAERISELCIKYHTPKVKLPWNELSHDYAPHYGELLAGRKIERVLEIGLGLDGLFHEQYRHGDSLRVWAELFPEAMIYGVDIRIDALLNEGERIRSFYCDQSDIESIANLTATFEQLHVWDFDLIVDDGSHKAKDQAMTALTIGEMLSPGGVYVIEDVIETAELLERLSGELKFHVIECSRAATMGDDRLLYFTGEENA